MTDVGFRVALDVVKAPRDVTRRFQDALARGLNEGGDRVRTQFQRGLWKQTGAKQYKSITSRVRNQRAHAGGLVYAIIGTGKGMPIKEFPVGLSGGHVLGMPWGTPHLFARSFGIQGRGVDGFRARLSSKRFPIRKLYGPSVPKEMGRGAMPALFLFSAQEFVPPAIVKHLSKAMG